MRETKANTLPGPLREQYEKARQAFDRDNLDYAITLLENILKQEPACYDAREVLRATQVKRQVGKTGFLKKVFWDEIADPSTATHAKSSRSTFDPSATPEVSK